MYPYKHIIPNNYSTMYRNNNYGNYSNYSSDGDRFFLAPLVVGGLAGTALGFGIANNNQMNRPNCCGMPPVMIQPYPYPVYHQPYGNFTSTNTNTNTFYN